MTGKLGLKYAEKYGLKKTAEAIKSGRNLDYKEIFEVAIKESSFHNVIEIIEEANNPAWACYFVKEDEFIRRGILEIHHNLGSEIMSIRPDENLFLRMEFYLERLKKVALSTRESAWAVAWTFFTGRDVDECIDIVCEAGDGYWIWILTSGLNSKKILTSFQMQKLYDALLVAKKNRISSVCYFAARINYLSLPDLKELRDIVFKSRDSMWTEWFKANVKMGSRIEWKVVKSK